MEITWNGTRKEGTDRCNEETKDDAANTEASEREQPATAITPPNVIKPRRTLVEPSASLKELKLNLGARSVGPLRESDVTRGAIVEPVVCSLVPLASDLGLGCYDYGVNKDDADKEDDLVPDAELFDERPSRHKRRG